MIETMCNPILLDNNDWRTGRQHWIVWLCEKLYSKARLDLPRKDIPPLTRSSLYEDHDLFPGGEG